MIQTEVTVTATRGVTENSAETAAVVGVVTRERAVEKPSPSAGHYLASEPGILIQQTTTGQVSPFLRGLTGYQVLNLVDGVRFNNATFRSGPNQYLMFVEPSQARRVEAMLGPSSSQYGSDALGGAIHVMTPEARFGSGGREWHGEVMVAGATADWWRGTTAQVTAGDARVAWVVGGGANRHGDLRAGGGLDSRNVYYRLFGLPLTQIRELYGSRMQDTGYDHYGAHGKLAVRLTGRQSLTAWYQRGELERVRGYKDLMGGLGRLQSSFAPQILDFFYTRYEKQQVGPLDTVSGTVSVNRQLDGGRRQNLRASDPVTEDYASVRATGYSGQASAHWGSRVAAVFGSDVYDEGIRSARWIDGVAARPLFPDKSRYGSYGTFGQGSWEVKPGRVRMGLGGRWTEIRFRSNAAQLAFRDVSYNASLVWQARRWLGFQALGGRGFRAPNLNDLGAIGLNDLGYEIPAVEATPAGALVGDSAGEGALSLGRRVERLRPEALVNVEFGARFTAERLYARAQVFQADLRDPIVRRTLLFPAEAAPRELAGLPVTVIAPTAGQRAQGVVAVATGFDPRATKAFVNDGQARYWGVESLLRYALSGRWTAEANYTFLAGRDLHPNRPIRRLSPQMGHAAIRYTRRGWAEVATTLVGAQRRLSGGDLDDERIGASRRRRDIADFFGGGTGAGASRRRRAVCRDRGDAEGDSGAGAAWSGRSRTGSAVPGDGGVGDGGVAGGLSVWGADDGVCIGGKPAGSELPGARFGGGRAGAEFLRGCALRLVGRGDIIQAGEQDPCE